MFISPWVVVLQPEIYAKEWGGNSLVVRMLDELWRAGAVARQERTEFSGSL